MSRLGPRPAPANLGTMCAQALIGEGYRAQVETSGMAALARLRATPVDLLIVDVQLADADGLAVMRDAMTLDLGLTAIVISQYPISRTTYYVNADVTY